MQENGLNHLAKENSPYLKQHVHNPVDWYPWGEEAFRQAKKMDKPIFLSIGYSTCHWCHVMAHESFENEEIAALMNKTFVNIKVDREEHPDVDQIYMTVCQLMTGRGGWPLTIIMTPDKVPFFAATYIPPHAAFGRTGMKELVPQIEDLWKNKRQEVEEASRRIMEHLNQSFSGDTADISFGDVVDDAYRQLKKNFDAQHGGFGQAPKFPSPHQLLFLLRYAFRTGSPDAINMVETTLNKMRQGGIYDHVGLGFHRYSTDAEWKLPHFEKMLYDQAMLMMAYSEMALFKPDGGFNRTVGEIFTYINDNLRSPEGAYYSAEDADSDGEEGKYYVWKMQELQEILTEDEYRLLKHMFPIELPGNFKEEASGELSGTNVLFRDKSNAMVNQLLNISESERQQQWENIRLKLKKHREKRVKPALDNKILTDWNGLMIAALSSAGRLPGNERMIQAAETIARFLTTHVNKDDGSLWHTYMDGQPAIRGKLDDYSFLVWGLTELYQVTLKEKYLQQALALQTIANKLFLDKEKNVYFMSELHDTHLIVRPMEFYDGAIPSGNSVMAWNLIHFYHITGDNKYKDMAENLMNAYGENLQSYPSGYTMLLNAIEFEMGTPAEIVLAADRPDEELKALWVELRKKWHPNTVIIGNSGPGSSLMKNIDFLKYQTPINGQSTVYICQNHVCNQPLTDFALISTLLHPVSQ